MQKHCINVRRFEEEDADEISKLIVRNFLEVNSKDYGIAAMEKTYKDFHRKGIGRKIINTLEQNEFYVRATRIEIPASITTTEYYRKFGYDYKNDVKELDEEHHYRLGKFKEAG